MSNEIWHPLQQGRALPDGRYELRLPFGSATELEMDILRHGEQVEVIGPEASLRARIRDRLARSLARYAGPAKDTGTAS
ncbi:MAG: WYL domain-containing protein [Burkholderiaceae bacterium]